MGEHFLRKHLIKLSRLYDMMYRPSEIAEEIGLTTETVYRSHLPAGAPFERDKNGEIWLHGLSFAAWAQIVYLRRKKTTLEPGEAWCCKCNQAVMMLLPKKKYNNRYIIILQGKCTVCGMKVNRIYSNNPESRAIGKAKVQK